MVFDGIITYTVIKELNNLILNGKVEKISIPNNSQIYFNLYANQKQNLVIDINATNARIHLTSIKKLPSLSSTPSNFCMVLRKHLEGSRIVGISQYKLDRIIQIDFETYTELKDKAIKSLIIELMGKYSNCILIDNKSQKIIDSFHRIDDSISSKRLVLPGLPYELPDTKLSFIETSKEDFVNNYKSDQFTSINEYILNMYNGFSNLSLKVLGIDESTDISIAYTKIHKLFNSIENNSIKITNANQKDMYISSSDEIDNVFSISKYIDKYYITQQEIINLKNAKQDLIKSIKPKLAKDTKNLKIFMKNLEECNKMESYRIYGELINANLYKLKSKVKSVELENFYNNNSPITIPLDDSLTPQKNAEKFFKKYNKLKTTFTYSSNQKELLENEIEYLSSIIYTIEASDNLEELQNIKQELLNQKYLSPKTDKKGRVIKEEYIDAKNNYLKFEKDGFTILVGKNNTQNDYITHKIAKDTDMWLHAQKIHGSHVLIQNGINAPISVIEYAASLAAYYSKGKLDSKVNIDYCLIKYVKRHASKKPGMVNYTDYSTILIEPTKMDK